MPIRQLQRQQSDFLHQREHDWPCCRRASCGLHGAIRHLGRFRETAASASFTGGTGPGSPCDGAAQPSIQNARLAHLGNGQVLVSADIISIPPAPPAVPGPALPMTAVLELNNGSSIPMEPLASGGWGAKGKGKIIGQNDYRITVFNGCFTAVFSFVKGVASSYYYGTSRQGDQCKPAPFAYKGDPVTTVAG